MHIYIYNIYSINTQYIIYIQYIYIYMIIEHQSKVIASIIPG